MGTQRAVVALALAGLLLTSGCIGFLTGEEALSFDSQSVQVSESATSDTGYQQFRKEENTVNETFSVAGQKRTVTVTNHVAEYSRSVGLPVFGDQQVARFSVFATPQVELAGQGPFNPVGDLSNKELVLRLQAQYEGLSDVEHVSDRKVTMLGEETEVSKFRASSKMETGQRTEVFIHITKVKHEGDFVIAIAIYPTKVKGEQQSVDRLLQGIKH